MCRLDVRRSPLVACPESVSDSPCPWCRPNDLCRKQTACENKCGHQEPDRNPAPSTIASGDCLNSFSHKKMKQPDCKHQDYFMGEVYAECLLARVNKCRCNSKWKLHEEQKYRQCVKEV